MTAAELDALAAIQASVRSCYEIARLRALSWEPGPVPPSPDAPLPCGAGEGGASAADGRKGVATVTSARPVAAPPGAAC